MYQASPNLRHPANREDIPYAPHHAKVPSKRIIPRRCIWPVRQILMKLEIEASGFDGAQAFRHADHVGDTIALLDTEADLAVMRVGVVVCVCHKPFVDAEDTAGFKDTVDLGVHAFEGGRVHGGFDGVDGVEAFGRKRHLLVRIYELGCLRVAVELERVKYVP